MVNQIQTFTNAEFGSIRVREIADREIEVNLEDAARGLGFTFVAKSGNAVIRWNRVEEYLTEIGYTGTVSKDAYIPERIFYRLAMKAKNDRAIRFQIWLADVAHDVRKHGAYLTARAVQEILDDPRALLNLLRQVRAAEADIEALQAQIAVLEPKARDYDRYLGTNGLITIGTIAQEFGVTAEQLNLHLKKLGIQYKVGSPKHGCWQLTAWAMRMMVARSEVWTVTRQHIFHRADGSEALGRPFMYWTPQGANFIREELTSVGMKLKEAD